MGKAINKKLANFKQHIPDDVQLNAITDQAKVVDDSIDNFLHELMIAICTVVLVVVLIMPFRVAAVETSHRKLQIAHDAIEQADENLRLNRDYYRVGSTKMSDLLLAQEQYQQARDRFADAYADFQTKQLEYRQATGQE